MTVGEIFLESVSTGVITEGEVSWLTSHQSSFDRPEEAAALRLGRLMDQGQRNRGRPRPHPVRGATGDVRTKSSQPMVRIGGRGPGGEEGHRGGQGGER